MKIVKAKRKGQLFDVLVDDEDFEFVSKTSWHIDDKGYARGCVGNKNKFMARLIMNATDPNIYVDHKNGNTLDNRRENLRLASNSQNQANRRNHSKNTSGYRGVTFSKSTNKWQAAIKVAGKNIHLGVFETPELAGIAYKQAADMYFGEFAEHKVAA